MTPEIIPGIFNELDKCDEQAPGMGPVHDEPLQENSSDLLLHNLLCSLCKEVKQHTREVVRVVVGVAQLVGDCIKKQVATLRVQVNDQSLEYVHWSTVGDGRRWDGQLLRNFALQLLQCLQRLEATVERAA